MTQSHRAVAVPNSAALNMAPGANLSAYIQAVGGIAVLSAERERELAERLYLAAFNIFILSISSLSTEATAKSIAYSSI